MSSIVANMRKKIKRISKSERKKAIELARNNTSGTRVNINFQERILPNTMYIDVKASTMKIGNTTQKLGDIPGEVIATDYTSSIKFLDYLKTLTADDIHKVILDNGNGFQHKSLEEFTSDIRKYLENERPVAQTELIVEPTSYEPLPDNIQINMNQDDSTAIG